MYLSDWDFYCTAFSTHQSICTCQQPFHVDNSIVVNVLNACSAVCWCSFPSAWWICFCFSESLAKQCELRNIDLSLCDVRLQDRESNAEIFIPLSHDTAHLVGRHVRITGRVIYLMVFCRLSHTGKISIKNGSARLKMIRPSNETRTLICNADDGIY